MKLFDWVILLGVAFFAVWLYEFNPNNIFGRGTQGAPTY